MDKDQITNLISQDKNTDSALKEIANTILNGQRISVEQGLLLYEKADVSFLGITARGRKDAVHRRRCGGPFEG